MAVQCQIRQYNAAGGVVVSSSGKRVLVLLRPERQGPNALPEVRLPKGHIEPGESSSQAAIREVREEAGLGSLAFLVSLGQQTVEFDWRGTHYIRDESYFLLGVSSDTQVSEPEAQFERLWLTWAEALDQLTFEAEREWIQRAWKAWRRRLEDIPDQHAQQADDHSQVQKQIPIGDKE